MIEDQRFAVWQARIANRSALEAVLEPILKTRRVAEWIELLARHDISAVRADGASHVRYLHSDPQPLATGFMVPSQSSAFAEKSPGGRYRRHAPVVGFSETPCEAGKPYEGPAVHTRKVLRRLGYGDGEIDRLAADRVIAVRDVLAEAATS